MGAKGEGPGRLPDKVSFKLGTKDLKRELD